MRKRVYSASITPLLTDGSLDTAGLRRIIERNIRHGLDGIFILGSMGEWSRFSDDFRDALIAESVAAAGDRIELLVGITGTTVPQALAHMRRAGIYRFDSYVFMLPPAGEVGDPVAAIRTVLDKADRPVYYYHCPPNNGINLSLAQFEDIMLHPNLKGIKNSASNMYLRRELIVLKREKQLKPLLLEGQEWAVDEALIVGYDGMLCGIGALGSRLMVNLARAVDNFDIPRAIALQEQLIRLFHGVYGKELQTVWVGLKYALKHLGLCASEFALAQGMEALTEDRKREIEACLAQMREVLD